MKEQNVKAEKKIVSFLLNEAEHTAIEEACKIIGISKTEYIKRRVVSHSYNVVSKNKSNSFNAVKWLTNNR